MPLTSKGEEIKSAMEKQYGEKKGEEVFYASKNKGTITGVDAATTAAAPADSIHTYMDACRIGDARSIADAAGAFKRK